MPFKRLNVIEQIFNKYDTNQRREEINSMVNVHKVEISGSNAAARSKVFSC